MIFERLIVQSEGAVLFAEIAAPPMNHLEPELVRDFGVPHSHRIARFPAAGHLVLKDRVNSIALASAEDFSRDSDLFGERVRRPEAQTRIQAAMKHGFQTPDAEMDLARMLSDQADN